jgi:hypothetical protein
MSAYSTFSTWREVQDYVNAHYTLFYHAPLDYRPVLVSAKVRRDGKIRVTPVYTDADPFTADAGHLDRFRRLVSV